MNKEETFTLEEIDGFIDAIILSESPVMQWEDFFESTPALRSLKGLPETKETAEHPYD